MSGLSLVLGVAIQFQIWNITTIAVNSSSVVHGATASVAQEVTF